MKVLVAIKLTYDINQLKFEKDGTPLLDACPKVMGEADKCAMEEAARLKESGKAGEVVALTIGSSKEHQRMLKDAYAMGATKAALFKVDDPDTLSALSVANIIAAFAEKTGPYDLILLGSGAGDTHSSIVGPIVASLLNTPLLANADRVSVEGNNVTIVSTLEDGQYKFTSKTPVVVTVTSEANEPRIPTIRDILRSKKKPIDEVSPEDIGVKLAMIDLVEIKKYEVPRKRVKIEATDNVEEAIDQLIKTLEQEGVI
ncbi:MAG: electron transfer flavoprotein subunit beta/FixA family protein [Desulfurococcales archaeon]|nr:electron transfer flavoprotein subunit beta/FixA family protein [Desulfurococcales archaeon]